MSHDAIGQLRRSVSSASVLAGGLVFLLCDSAKAQDVALSPLAVVDHPRVDPAADTSTDGERPKKESKHRAWHWSVTTKVLGGVTYLDEGYGFYPGFGMQFDFPMVEHELEIELGATYHREHSLGMVSGEALLAHVFDHNEVLQPYVAIGPSFVLAEDKLYGALHTSVGTNIWTRGHWGAHLETAYIRVFVPDLDEWQTGAGVSYRY